jgi:hypothetical protein
LTAPFVVKGASPVKTPRWFHSKAKEVDMRVLSNFWSLPEGRVLPAGLVLVPAAGRRPALVLPRDAHRIEAALVQVKAVLSEELEAGACGRVLDAVAAADGLADGTHAGRAVKIMGGKAAFRAAGLSLNVPVYDSVAQEVMRVLVRARAEVDPRYHGLVSEANTTGTILRHFARGLHYQRPDGTVFTAATAAGRNAEALGAILQAVVRDMDTGRARAGAVPEVGAHGM